MSLSYLADERISPETAGSLRAPSFPCRSQRREGPRRLADQEIASQAKPEGLVILTDDLDFGEIFCQAADGELGIMVLRLRQQTVEAANGLHA